MDTNPLIVIGCEISEKEFHKIDLLQYKTWRYFELFGESQMK
jgi:hypothetical protein